MVQKPIYLDYNATTPLDPIVIEAMLPYLTEHFGNPSSSHAYGAQARRAVESARGQVSGMLGCLPEEIIFTSGGSESNNMAIIGIAEENSDRGKHIITSVIEHPAVLEVCAHLEKSGFVVTYLPVDESGMVDPLEVQEAIRPDTILISVMHANNEVGTIQPIQAISKIAHSHNIIMHTDAAQSVGKIPVRVEELGIDLLSIAGHKLYAPKGIGALYIRSGVRLKKLIHGASHERNLRAGTENVAGVVGLGKACELVSKNLYMYLAHLQEMRDEFEKNLVNRFPWVRINGHRTLRLPNTSSVSFKGMEANAILADLPAMAASAGAACHSDRVNVSHVLKAMRIPLEYAMGTIRFSTGRFTTNAEITLSMDAVVETITRLTENRPVLDFR